MNQANHVVRACSIAMGVLFATTASAGSSGGKGGTLGTRSDWPCTGCAVNAPMGLDTTRPAKLVVALHGDEGTAVYAFNMWGAHTSTTTDFILFAPLCPQPSCSDGSWWKTGPPTNDWLNQQIALVEAQYDIDYDYEFLTGWSGGATYIGAVQLPLYSDRYGASNMNSGGVPPQPPMCPTCTIPLWFRVGDQDFMLPYVNATRDFYKTCGDTETYDLLAGLDHQNAIASLDAKIPAMLDWFRMNPDVCPGRRGIGPDAGAGGDAGVTPGDDAGGVDAAAPPPEGDGGGNGDSPAGADAGCGCRTAPVDGRGPVGAMSVAAVALLAARRRRNR